MLAEVGTVSTADVARAGYCRKARPTPFDYYMTRLALARIAVPVGRGGGRGRPILWRKRNRGSSSHAKLESFGRFY
jgi:hypothetical protein